ncbi:MAG TPA: hypothetical protein VNX68_06785, partial [Nitrosopumilaceae archaeon]|nr:hypothetical protein [Nitrosopumilaceae archaeon]
FIDTIINGYKIKICAFKSRTLLYLKTGVDTLYAPLDTNSTYLSKSIWERADSSSSSIRVIQHNILISFSDLGVLKFLISIDTVLNRASTLGNGYQYLSSIGPVFFLNKDSISIFESPVQYDTTDFVKATIYKIDGFNLEEHNSIQIQYDSSEFYDSSIKNLKRIDRLIWR